MQFLPIKKGAWLAFISMAGFSYCFGQFPEKLKNGLRFDLDSTKRHHITLNMTAQLWMRNTDQNPGTTVEAQTQANTTDISIRRIRFVLSGALTDRVNFYVQFGQNNLNYLSARKSGFFFHDITVDYAVAKKYLSIGGGLNGWNGPSRFSNAAVSSILVLDPPGFQEVTNDTYDQFVRRLGVYAKGKIGKLDYRLSVAKPFVIQTTSGSGVEPISTNASFSTLPPSFVHQGYFSYQFFDQENNAGPAMTGSYLGKKKIFNIGGGFYYQRNAMYRLANHDVATQDTVKQDMRLFAVDIFYEAPVNEKKGTAISWYASFSNYNYGNNFIRVGGPNNPATGTKYTSSSFTRANYGNAFPYLGTGTVGYIQSAYKFRDGLLGDQGTLQPYLDCQYAQYDRLSNPMCVFDVGINWLMNGNNSKITLNYQNRPFFAPTTTGDLVQQARLAEWVLQYQVAF